VGGSQTLAVAKTDAPDDLFEEHVIRSVGDARHDATVLGLIRDDGGDPELTRRGREAVRTVGIHHGGILPALQRHKEKAHEFSRGMNPTSPYQLFPFVSWGVLPSPRYGYAPFVDRTGK
jgi:hypothetical protein